MQTWQVLQLNFDSNESYLVLVMRNMLLLLFIHIVNYQQSAVKVIQMTATSQEHLLINEHARKRYTTLLAQSDKIMKKLKVGSAYLCMHFIYLHSTNTLQCYSCDISVH